MMEIIPWVIHVWVWLQYTFQAFKHLKTGPFVGCVQYSKTKWIAPRCWKQFLATCRNGWKAVIFPCCTINRVWDLFLYNINTEWGKGGKVCSLFGNTRVSRTIRATCNTVLQMQEHSMGVAQSSTVTMADKVQPLHSSNLSLGQCSLLGDAKVGEAGEKIQTGIKSGGHWKVAARTFPT